MLFAGFVHWRNHLPPTNYLSYSSQPHSRDKCMLQYTWMNKSNLTEEWTQGQKWHDTQEINGRPSIKSKLHSWEKPG